MAAPDLTVYLAETGTDAVGTASMMLMPHVTYDCRPTAFIEAVVVRYAHRRRGVAALLLQLALKDAHAASCLKIQLLSHRRHNSDGAHHLYRAMGFTPEAEGFRLYLEPSYAKRDKITSLSGYPVLAARRHASIAAQTRPGMSRQGRPVPLRRAVSSELTRVTSPQRSPIN